MKLKNFNDCDLTLTISVDEFKTFAEFLSAVTSVVVDYRNGVFENDYERFKSCLDNLNVLSHGSCFEMRHFFTDLANAF